MEREISTNGFVLGSAFKKEAIKIIKEAKESLKIAFFEWQFMALPRDPFIHEIDTEILHAKKRGVDIKILVNFQATKTKLCSAGLTARVPVGKRTMHAKFIIADEKIVLLGSHNISSNALRRNIEASFIIRHNDSIKSLSKYFNTIFDQNG